MKLTKADLKALENARGRLAVEAKRLLDLSEKVRFDDPDLSVTLWRSGKEAIDIAVRLRDQVLPMVR